MLCRERHPFHHLWVSAAGLVHAPEWVSAPSSPPRGFRGPMHIYPCRFLDNVIMLFAGEGIDNALGLRLGITTLASAGLGNLFADVVGVSAASGIEVGWMDATVGELLGWQIAIWQSWQPC